MSRVRHLRGPNLKNPYSGWDKVANNIAQTSQNVLDGHARKEEADALSTYRKDTLKQKQDNIDKKQEFETLKYNNTQAEKKNKTFANTFALKTMRPDIYSNIGQEFGQTPTKENAKKMDAITGNIDLSKIKQTKSKHVLKSTNQGYVMFDTTNPEAEPIPVTGNYKPAEKPKSNTNGRKTNEILNWMTINKGRAEKGLSAMPFEEFYNNKTNTKKMGVGLRDADSVKRETERVSKVIGINPYQMSSQDFSNLDPQKRYEMNNLIAYREQGLKSKVPDWMKKNLDNLSAVVYSAGEVSKSLSSQDSGLIDASLNKVNQYLGMGDSSELAKRTLTQSNYQLYSNYMLKSLSGLAVTKPEETRFTKAFGSLFMSDSVTAMKIKTNMENLAFRLETMKKSYDPITFNYRYGHLQRSVNSAVQRMSNTIENYNNNAPTQHQNFVNADGSQHQNFANPEVTDIVNKSQPQMLPQADNSHINEEGQTRQRTVVRTGTYQGQKVIEYSDGNVEYE